MSFFEDTTVTDLVDLTIEKVTSLEDKEAKKMLSSFKEVRRELQDRLLTVRGGSFTQQHLRIVLMQVEAVISALNSRMKDDMNSSIEILGERGVNDLVTEIDKFSKHFEGAEIPLNLDAIAIAMESKNFLINKYQSSIDAYSQALRQQITQGVTNSMIMGDSLSDVVSDIGQFFIGEEWKIQRIARTELHGMYNLAKQQGMENVQENYFPDLKKALFHPMDQRTGDDSKLANRLNLVVSVDKPFKYKYKGQMRVYMTPPDRANDRSIMVPYREVWDK